jgi:hypothetical protein
VTDLQTRYYLVHRDTEERCFGAYKTRAGARVAQRARNSHLGFTHRLERASLGDNWEVERCLVDGEIVDATYVIQEATVELYSDMVLEEQPRGPAAGDAGMMTVT